MAHSILIAEDDQQVRGLLRRVLESAGYDVCEAANGEEAMRACRAAPFDVVVADILMPQRDGIEMIIHLRKTMPNIPVIAISGANDPLFLANAAGLGAARTLSKPFSPQKLLNVVQELTAAPSRPGGD